MEGGGGRGKLVLPIPRPADVARLVDDEAFHPQLAQAVELVDAREAGADDEGVVAFVRCRHRREMAFAWVVGSVGEALVVLRIFFPCRTLFPKARFRDRLLVVARVDDLLDFFQFKSSAREREKTAGGGLNQGQQSSKESLSHRHLSTIDQKKMSIYNPSESPEHTST